MNIRIDGLLDEGAEALHLKVGGEDRPNIIAEVAGKLEHHQLYVSSISFSLALPSQDEFSMEILAKGSLAGLKDVKFAIDSGKFFEGVDGGAEQPPRVSWAEAHFFHLALYTPDQEALTARLARIVGKRREGARGNVCPHGSFVHLLGITHNAAGAQGATPYFSLRANVATESLPVQEEIIEDLHEFAEAEGIGNDLWTRDLNKGR